MNTSALNATVDPARAPLVVTVAVASLVTPAVLGSVLYPLVLVAIARNRKDFSSPYYAYLFSIAICELVTLYYYGVYGVVCVLGGSCLVPQAFDRLFSALSGFTLWYLEFATDLIIAFDRFVAICFYARYSAFNSRRWISAMIGTSWLIAIAFSWPMLTWLLPVMYVVDEFQADFENFTDAASRYNTVILDILFGVLAVEALLYVVSFGFLFNHRHAAEAVSVHIRRAQRNLLLQSFLSVTLLSSTVILTPYLDFTQVWTNYANALLNQLVPMNRLFVALLLNAAIRAKVWKIMRCMWKKKSHAVEPARRIHVLTSGQQLPHTPHAESRL